MLDRIDFSVVDSHVHSTFSPDSQLDAEIACQRAVDLGLQGLIFTDHLDIDYPDPKFFFEFDVAKRSAHLHALAEKYANGLTVLQGVEVGYRPITLERSRRFMKNGQFDFVLMSIHVIDDIGVTSPRFFEGKTQQEAYEVYLQAIYESVCSFGDYDVVGHIGYARRYAPAGWREMNYADYADIIDSILKRVIADGKGIEVNVSGYRDGLCGPLPDAQILKRYKQLGGKIITMGSDSHGVASLGHSFNQARKLLLECGFDQIVYFKKRKPIFVTL